MLTLGTKRVERIKNVDITRTSHRKRKIASQNCMCGVKKRKIIAKERKEESF